MKTTRIVVALALLAVAITLIGCSSSPTVVSEESVMGTITAKETQFRYPSVFYKITVSYQGVEEIFGVLHKEYKRYEIGDQVPICWVGEEQQDGTIDYVIKLSSCSTTSR